MPSDQSTMFDKNLKFLKIFGIWPGRTKSKYYKYYSMIYLFITLVFYNLILTLNLLCTPQKIEFLLNEVMFYFTEITVASKALTFLLLRDKILDTFSLIDCDEFVGDYDDKNGILYKTRTGYILGSSIYSISSNVAFTLRVFVPIFLSLVGIGGIPIELPLCNYYFLSDEVRESYFVLWFLYQSTGLYSHMMYNIHIDSMTAGLLIITIVQLKILNNNLTNFKLTEEERNLPIEIQDKIQIARLNTLLRHYEAILKYCQSVQDMLSATLFIQFGVGSIIICVVTCRLLLPVPMNVQIFLVIFIITMTMQIFVPGYLGAQISHESQELVTAAYNSDWISRSESFKRNLMLFRQRAQTPIVLSGLKMFPLTLVTFTSIMKTAYSFFTLVGNVLEE